jgi:hypothetical protein
MGYSGFMGFLEGHGSHAPDLGGSKIPVVGAPGVEGPNGAPIYSVDGVRLTAPFSDSLLERHPHGTPVDFAKEGQIPVPADTEQALNTPAPGVEAMPMKTETLIIKEGSSIEGTLNRFLDTKHTEMPNHGNVAHKMFEGAMNREIKLQSEYIKINHDALTKAGTLAGFEDKLAEYQKMLATGRVNIQPGAELTIVEHNGRPLLMEIKGEIKMLNGDIVRLGNDLPPSPAANTPSAVVGGNVPTPAQVEVPIVPKVKVEDVLPYNPEHDYQKLETEMDVEKAIGEMGEKYKEVLNDAMMNPAGGDGSSVEQGERIGTFGNARKDMQLLLNEMRAEDAPWKSVDNIETLLEKGAGTKQILRVSLNNITSGHGDKFSYWSEIKNKSAINLALFNEAGDRNEGAASVMKQFSKIIGKEAMPLSYKETTANWLARITRLALKEKASI